MGIAVVPELLQRVERQLVIVGQVRSGHQLIVTAPQQAVRKRRQGITAEVQRTQVGGLQCAVGPLGNVVVAEVEGFQAAEGAGAELAQVVVAEVQTAQAFTAQLAVQGLWITESVGGQFQLLQLAHVLHRLGQRRQLVAAQNQLAQRREAVEKAIGTLPRKAHTGQVQAAHMLKAQVQFRQMVDLQAVQTQLGLCITRHPTLPAFTDFGRCQLPFFGQYAHVRCMQIAGIQPAIELARQGLALPAPCAQLRVYLWVARPAVTQLFQPLQRLILSQRRVQLLQALGEARNAFRGFYWSRQWQ